MAWVDQTYLISMIGTNQVTALGLTTGARLTQYELDARSTVQSVLQYAGYQQFTDTLDASNATVAVTAAFLQKITAALIVRNALALLPGISLPEAVDAAITRSLSMLDAVYNKKLPVPNAQPSSAEVALGGAVFNTAATPRRFNLRGTTF